MPKKAISIHVQGKFVSLVGSSSVSRTAIRIYTEYIYLYFQVILREGSRTNQENPKQNKITPDSL